MAYFSPIEAHREKLKNIKINNGNFIVDVGEHQLLYDTKDNKRITISSLEFVDSEQDLLKTQGIPGKLYIIKSTGAVYFWVGEWNSISQAGDLGGNPNLVVDPNGSEDNDGTDPDKPAKTLSQLIDRYGPTKDITIHITGPITEVKDVNIDSKNNITIIGDDDTATITGNINITNSTFHLINLRINGTLIVKDSIGTIDKCDITRINNSNTSVSMKENSFGEYTGDGNGLTTIADCKDRGKYNNVIITADNGSIISVIETSNSFYEKVVYETFNMGKIYRNSQPISEDEKNFIFDLFSIKEIY